MAELFFGLPSARLALGQLLSVSAGGFRDSEGGEEESLLEKKEGGVQQGLCTDISFCRPTATVLQHSKERRKKKGFPAHYPVPFCSARGGRNVGVKWALFIAHCAALEQSVY